MSSIGAVGAVGVYGIHPYSPVNSPRRNDLSPVTPVERSPVVSGGKTSVLPYDSADQASFRPAVQMPDIRQGFDTRGMAVRGQIQYLSPEEVDELIAQMNGQTTEKAQTPAEVAEEGQCETCENRKYQDGSNDPGVSFKTPGHIDPDQAASVVRGHEMEHVAHEQAKAERENRDVIRQSVTLHTSICPECGTTYVSGGTTETVTRAEQKPAAQQEQAQRAPFEIFA